MMSANISHTSLVWIQEMNFHLLKFPMIWLQLSWYVGLQSTFVWIQGLWDLNKFLAHKKEIPKCSRLLQISIDFKIWPFHEDICLLRVSKTTTEPTGREHTQKEMYQQQSAYTAEQTGKAKPSAHARPWSANSAEKPKGALVAQEAGRAVSFWPSPE